MASGSSVAPGSSDEPGEAGSEREEPLEDTSEHDQDDPTTGDLETGEVVDGEIAEDEHEREDRRISLTSGSFSGPLPLPSILADYDKVVPGLAREIVDQWKGETAHRHQTIDALRETDRLAMKAYYEGERRGQYLATVVFLGVVALAVVAIVLHSTAVGIAAIVTGGASAIWAMRRRSAGPALNEPVDLADADALEKVPARQEP